MIWGGAGAKNQRLYVACLLKIFCWQSRKLINGFFMIEFFNFLFARSLMQFLFHPEGRIASTVGSAPSTVLFTLVSPAAEN